MYEVELKIFLNCFLRKAGRFFYYFLNCETVYYFAPIRHCKKK